MISLLFPFHLSNVIEYITCFSISWIIWHWWKIQIGYIENNDNYFNILIIQKNLDWAVLARYHGLSMDWKFMRALNIYLHGSSICLRRMGNQHMLVAKTFTYGTLQSLTFYHAISYDAMCSPTKIQNIYIKKKKHPKYKSHVHVCHVHACFSQWCI